MDRWLFRLVLLALIVVPPAALAQDPVPELELGELEIVGAQERWPAMFTPDTRIEPGLAPREMADRYAYRAAEYSVSATHLRYHFGGPLEPRQWPGRLVYGDGHFERVTSGWADELDTAAARSRVLSVQYNLVAFEVVRTAALGAPWRTR